MDAVGREPACTALPEPGWDGVRDGLLELAPGRTEAGPTPLVLVPPLFGERALVDACSLVRHLDPDRRVVLLDLQGRSGLERPIDSVRGLTAHYLERLRVAVPTGPVVLAGHSLGGVIALEMARRLDDDARGPHGGPAGAPAGRSAEDAAGGLAREGPEGRGGPAGDAAGGGPSVELVVMFDSRVSDDQVARVRAVVTRPLRRARQAIRSRRGVPADVGREVKAATRRAWLVYRPRQYAGRVVYLAARGIEGKPEVLRRYELWTPVLPAVEVREVAGGHSGPGSLLDEPHVAVTAAVLEAALLDPGPQLRP